MKPYLRREGCWEITLNDTRGGAWGSKKAPKFKTYLNGPYEYKFINMIFFVPGLLNKGRGILLCNCIDYASFISWACLPVRIYDFEMLDFF